MHASRGNPAGAATNLRGARVRLVGAAAAGHDGGFDIPALLAAIDDRLARLQTGPAEPTEAASAPGSLVADPPHDVAGPPGRATRPPLGSRTTHVRTEDGRVTFPGRPQIPTIDVREAATGAAGGAGADGAGAGLNGAADAGAGASAAGAGASAAPLLVDVRERNEFVQVRAPGAVLYPTSSFLLRFEELPRDRPLHVICNSGSRSAAVTAWLLRNGWSDVHNVAGGMVAWLRAGLETGADRSPRARATWPDAVRPPARQASRRPVVAAGRRRVTGGAGGAGAPRLPPGQAGLRRRLRNRLKKSFVFSGWLYGYPMRIRITKLVVATPAATRYESCWPTSPPMPSAGRTT